MYCYPILKIRSDFPILSKKINKYPFTYLDNAASTHKPNIVIKSQNKFYSKKYATVHRGIYKLGNKLTNNMEKIRFKIYKFINANFVDEIIFTKGCTESINLIANSWGKKFLNKGDNIIITEMEHHSNIVPWQILSKEKKIKLLYIPLIKNGILNIEKFLTLINKKTKIVSITHISNVLGIKNNLSKIISIIRKKSNAIILIDGAQGIAHLKIDVQKIDCDFYVFSGHKIYAPSGIGILYGKKKLLNSMPPWEGGGSMIKSVSLTKGTKFNCLPWKFEAGSPNISGIIGLGSALKYINNIGLNKIFNHQKKIIKYAYNKLKNISNIILYGSNKPIGIISFNLNNYNAYDISNLLDNYGISIRTGHLCAMPLMNFYNVESMCRISIGMYNNKNDIDHFISSLIHIKSLLRN